MILDSIACSGLKTRIPAIAKKKEEKEEILLGNYRRKNIYLPVNERITAEAKEAGEQSKFQLGSVCCSVLLLLDPSC